MNRSGFPPLPFFAALAALATYAAVSLLVRMAEYGPFIDWDSVHYISVAGNLLNGNGFVAANAEHFEWAPLYPMLLAAAGALASVDPRDAVGPLNAVLFGMWVVAAGAWLRRTLDSRFLIVCGCLVAALSPALTLAAAQAGSETAFVLFATLALIRLDRHLVDSRRSSLWWAAIFAGLAWTTRYVGVIVAIASVAALALRRGVSPRDKLGAIAVYSLVSAAPVGVWISGNLLVTGSVAYTWLEAVETCAGAVGTMLVDPHRLAQRDTWPAFQLAVGGLSLLALAAALVAGARRTRAPEAGDDGESSFRLFGGFVVLYVCIYAVTAVTLSAWPGVEGRHLSPVYMPLLFSGLLAADRYLRRQRRQQPETARATDGIGDGGRFMAAALSLWIAWNAPAHLIDALDGHGTRGGYMFYYRDSEVMRHLRDNSSDADLYSNAPYASWAAGAPGSGVYLYLPDNPESARPADAGDPRGALGALLERAEHGDRVVWMFDNEANRLYSYDDAHMRAHAWLRLVADLADGAVFQVKKTFDGETNERMLAALTAKPDVRAVFDIRIRDDRLIYSRTPCVSMDTGARFFLHVFPADDSILPDDRKRHGFVGLDFDFKRVGAWIDEMCAAEIILPDWEIARILTGQFADFNRFWEADISLAETGTGHAATPSEP